MVYARERLSQAGFIFAHRYVTRPATAGGENHISLTEREFETRLRLNLFAMHWQSHGNRYGLGREIDLWLGRGAHVAVNGSRGYYPAAKALYPDLAPVLVTVEEGTLRERLRFRGREDRKSIEERLARSFDLPTAEKDWMIVDNGGSLEEAGEEIIRLMLQLKPSSRFVEAASLAPDFSPAVPLARRGAEEPLE